MKPIGMRTHGVLDYAMAILLASVPFMAGLDVKAMESTILFSVAALMVIYSLMTNYPLGVVKVLPMPVHLMLDVLSGLFLAAAPWLFDFADRTMLPHLILGGTEVVAALMTRPKLRDSSNLISTE